jgi:DNA-binding IclR family transcriptional regulator
LRENGIALEQEEGLIGECAVASPVFDAASSRAVGAIGIVVPSGAWPVDATARDAVREAARTISRELGARNWPAQVG